MARMIARASELPVDAERRARQRVVRDAVVSHQALQIELQTDARRDSERRADADLRAETILEAFQRDGCDEPIRIRYAMKGCPRGAWGAYVMTSGGEVRRPSRVVGKVESHHQV